MTDGAPARSRLVHDAGRVAARLVSWLRGQRFRILLYHSIADDPADPFAVPPHVLDDHLGELCNDGWRFLSMGEACDRLRDGASLRRTAVLTFDDGFEDFAANAWPCLLSFAARPTLFVPTAELGERPSWQPGGGRKRILSARELRSLGRAGVELGAHGECHVRLTALSGEERRASLRRARRAMDELGAPRRVGFAYPYGDAPPGVRDDVRGAGFEYAVIAGGLWGNGRGSDPWLLTRVLVTRRMGAAALRAALSRRGDCARLVRDLRGTWGRSQRRAP